MTDPLESKSFIGTNGGKWLCNKCETENCNPTLFLVIALFVMFMLSSYSFCIKTLDNRPTPQSIANTSDERREGDQEEGQFGWPSRLVAKCERSLQTFLV